jgi:hypothetical protein
VVRLLEIDGVSVGRSGIDLDGAERAADEILALVEQEAAPRACERRLPPGSAGAG